MTIEDIQNEIIDEFSMFEDWEERYQYMIDLGKEYAVFTALNKGAMNNPKLKTVTRDAFNFLEDNLKENPNYFKRFYSAFNEIKLSFLVTNYPDAVSVNRDTILGSWERVYNFPNNQVIKDPTLQYNFKQNTFTNKQAQEFTYKLRNDSIFFYFNSNLKKPISSFKAQYSEEYETLIFENVPIDQGKFQTQYYRRVK